MAKHKLPPIEIDTSFRDLSYEEQVKAALDVLHTAVCKYKRLPEDDTVVEEIELIRQALQEWADDRKLFSTFPYAESTAREMLIILTNSGIKNGKELMKRLKDQKDI